MASEATVAPKPKDTVASLAAQLPHLSTGDRAALRRLYLTRSAQADGVVIGLLHRAGAPPGAWGDIARFRRWRMIAHVAAVLSGTAGDHPHAPGRRLGAALFRAGYSENRLMRLTAARGEPLGDQVRRVAQFLAKSGAAPVDLRELERLLSDSEDVAEEARFRIARDYYDAGHAPEKEADA